MKRQTSQVATRVYAYGAVPSRVAPVLGEDAGLAQMRLAGRLWNVLVAIDRARVERYRRIMRDDGQEQIEKLKADKDSLRESMRARRKQARTRSVDVSDLQIQIDSLRPVLATLVEQRKQTAQARHDARRADLDALQSKTNARVKRARQAAASMGLYWGTYNDIVQRADAARKHGGELNFHGFRGEGTVTAQIIGGAAVASCIAGDHTFFRVDAPTDGQRWRYAHVRIGSNEDRTSRWLSLPIVFHRDIPAEAHIKSVSATRRVVAGKTRWQVNVTVTLPRPEEKHAGPAVAFDLGWRLLPTGVRVGYWQDEAGKHGEILVPMSHVDQFGKVRSLRSICDQSRDEFLPSLAQWLAARELSPEWQRRSSHVAQWRSSDRLSALIGWWRDNRIAGDEETFAGAVAWRKQYLHLANWWKNLSDQLRLSIRELYRVFAAGVARSYACVIVEDFDLREVARKPAADAEPQSINGHYRQMVSPSVFRAELLKAATREGLRIVKLPAAYTTRKCHVCGALEEWNQIESIMHRCGVCNETWDQDRNAAINLLASGKAALGENERDGVDNTPPFPGEPSKSLLGGLVAEASRV